MRTLPKLVAGAMLFTTASCKKPAARITEQYIPPVTKTVDVFVGQHSGLPHKLGIADFFSDMFLGKLTELSASTGINHLNVKSFKEKVTKKTNLKDKKKVTKASTASKTQKSVVTKKQVPASPAPTKTTSTMDGGRYWVTGRNISYSYPREHKVTKDMQKGYVLSNFYGVSLYRMKIANPNINFDKLIPVGTTIKIPGRYFIKPGSVQNFRDVVSTTKIDKHYIQDILIGIEGRHKRPDTKAYYDGVKSKTHPRGVLTIGFGHTGRIDGKALTAETRISEAKAYELLAQDILDAKVDAIVYMGKVAFNKAPESIQTGLIDIVFNKGVEPFTRKGSPTAKLKKNIQDEHYASAAANMVLKPTVRGLLKRNIYRSIMSMSDLNSKQRENALNALRPDYIATLNLFSGNEKKLMQRAWANAQKGKTHSFFK